MKRAGRGVTLVLTVDVPVRTRARGLQRHHRRSGTTMRMLAGILTSPGYLRSLLRHGQPRFGNLKPYTKNNADVNEVAAFVRREMGGAFTWDEIAKYRERWKRPLVVKCILHPSDAEKCVALGVDGIVVSNHGGRQVKACPPRSMRSRDCPSRGFAQRNAHGVRSG